MRTETIRGSFVALATAAGVCLTSVRAHAQDVTATHGRVIFAIDQGVDDDRTIVLRAELGLRALELELVPALAGLDDAAREQQARMLAERHGAYGTLWVDDELQEARAVTPAGTMRRATLPRRAQEIDARVLAVILASVLDEALAPPGRSPIAASEPDRGGRRALDREATGEDRSGSADRGACCRGRRHTRWQRPPLRSFRRDRGRRVVAG